MSLAIGLKEKLLQTECFIDNDYLDTYIKLCLSSDGSNADQLHHILPISYFTDKFGLASAEAKRKFRHKLADSASEEYAMAQIDNTVKLSFYDHCLAHWLLYKCTVEKLKTANELAFLKMVARTDSLANLPTEEILLLIGKANDIYADPDSYSHRSKAINDIIRAAYATGGYKGCRAKLQASGIALSKESIKNRARSLGVRSAKFTVPWSERELMTLSENYPKHGYKKCLELLPGRNKAAIQARAKYLSLRAPGTSKANHAWRHEEIDILKTYYPAGG